ncbi:hypothetical protein [Pseudobythopirellula maris]|uniref:hypothetical protein n=1 Tax=Pseudobythopirellula maris TaxID=2527991 RepID=UPI0011B7D5B6|nr:hypothetical protein [Pseudobythopirellula maris]
MQIDLPAYWRENPPNEGLLFSVDYDPSSEIAVVVYEYVAESVSRHFQGLPPLGYRDFRKLTLREASALVVTSFESADTTESLRILRERISFSPICIVSYKLGLLCDVSSLGLEIANSFNLQLCFYAAEAESRLVRSTQVGEDEWLHHDLETGEEIDFYRPFDAGNTD